MDSVSKRVVRKGAHLWAARRLSRVARQVRHERLTYLSPDRLRTLESLARAAAPGNFVECGVALGGSAIVLAMRVPAGFSFHGYDVFGMIPPPGANDPPKVHERYETITSGGSEGIGGDVYYGYRDELLEETRASFRRFGVPVDGGQIHLHQGTFEATLDPPTPVALAHIDSDWYASVRICLERVYPRLGVGGVIVLDDYNDYGGCRRATDEFVENSSDLSFEQAAGGNVILRLRTG